jgi:hypothetical protein
VTADDDASAPPRGGMSTRTKIRIAVAVIALVVVGCIAVGVKHVLRSMNESTYIKSCRNNASQLGEIYFKKVGRDRRAAQERSGPAMWLVMRKGGVAEIRPGAERIFICPADDDADVPTTVDERKRWDDVDLDHVPRDLCSYAGRDFARCPIPADANHPREPIGACVRHREGAMVAFDDGDVAFVTLAELGVASEDEMIVGPESKSPVLRVLRFGDGSVR